VPDNWLNKDNLSES